jgi:hypothetical protein
MHHPRAAQPAQRAGYLPSEHRHQVFRQTAGGSPQQTVEIPALAEIGNDETEGLGVEDVPDTDGEVRTAGLLAADLVLEQLFLLRGRVDCPVDHLHTD